MHPPATIAGLNEAIEAGRVNCAEIVATAVHRLNDPSGEGARTFVTRNISARRKPWTCCGNAAPRLRRWPGFLYP